MALCKDCGEQPKRPRHPSYCEECWLRRQPATVRVEAARARLELVPPTLRVKRVPEKQWPPGRRWCAACQSFVRNRDCSPSGSRCKDCIAAQAHASRLKKTYLVGSRPFTDQDYRALMELQGGRCYLCRRLPTKHRLVVDHDHATGQVRGLLCGGQDWSCNYKILSQFDKDPDPAEMAMRLVRYLQGDTPARALR